MNKRLHTIWKFLSKIKNKDKKYYTQCIVYLLKPKKDEVYKTEYCGLIIGMGLPERDINYE